MTSIGTVFVNVQPDTSGFAEKLRAGLSRVSTEDIKVKATPDTGGFVERLRADLARVRAEDIKVKAVPDTAGFTQRLRADLARAAAEDIKVKAVPDTSGFTQRLRADLARASAEDIKVKVIPDTSDFRQRLRADLARAATESIKVKAEPDTSGFGARLRGDLSRITENVKVKVTPDTSGFAARLRAELAHAASQDIKVKVEPDFTGFRDAVRLELAWIRAHESLKIRVTADSDHLRQEIRDAIIRAQVGQRINIPMNATGGLGGLGGGGGGAGGLLSFAPAFSALGVSIAALIPAATALASALTPVVALLGSAIPAAAVGAGAAFAAIAGAFTGVIGAIKAYATEQKNASNDAVTAANQQRAHASAVRSATNSVANAQTSLSQAYQRAARVREDSARAVEDAERNLTRAQQDAADQNTEAAQRVQDAEQKVRDAQINAREAQQELNDARRQAVEDLDDMRRSLRQTALDERGGVLSVLEAQQRLNEVRADPKSTELERQRAKLSYDQAVASLDDIRDRLGDQKEQYSQASRAGVEGTDRVRQAEKNVADAASQVTSAQRDLTDAHKEQIRTAADGQQAVADAQRAVSDAFRNQKQAQEDSAAAIQQAQRGLKEAQEQLATAIQSSMDQGSSSTRKFADAMQQLSPIGRELVRTLISLQPAWDALQKRTQQEMFPGVLDAITRIKGTLPNLIDIIGRTARVMGDLASQFGRMFASAAWQRDIRTVGLANVTVLRNLGMASLNVLDIFRNLSAAVAPFVVEFSRLVLQLSATWKQQIEVARQSGALNTIFRQGMDVLKELGRIIGNTFSGLWTMLRIGYPYGKQLLDLIEGWSARFKDWTKTAQGQQRLNDFFSGAVVIFKALGAAVLIVAGAYVQLVALIGKLAPQLTQVGSVLLGTVNPAFTALSTVARNTLGPALAAIGTVVIRDVAPALASLVNALSRGVAPVLEGLGRAIQSSVAPALGSMARTITGVLAPALGNLAQTVGQRLGQVLQEAGKFIQDHLVPAFNSLARFARDVVVPALQGIANVVGDLAVVFLKVLGPAVDGVRLVLDGLRAILAPLAGLMRDHREAVALAAAAWALFNRSMITAAVLNLLHGLGSAIGSIRGALSSVPQLLSSFVTGLRSLGGGSILLGTAALGGIALAITAVVNALDAWANGSQRTKAQLQALTEQVRRNPGDLDSYRQALKNVNAAIDANMFTMRENAGVWDWVGKVAQISAGLITGSAERDAQSIGSLRNEQRRLMDQQNNLTANTTLLNNKYFGFRDVVSGLARTYHIDLSGSLEEADRNFRNAMAAIDAGAPKTAALGGRIRELAGQEDRANTEADTFRNTLDLLFGRFLGYENAASNTADAIKEIGQEARAAGGRIGTFNGLAWAGSEAQINLRKTLDRAFEGLQNQAEAYQRQGHSAEEARRWLDEHIAALYRQALALGVNKRDLDAWARSLGLAPDAINRISGAANGMRQSLNNAGTAASGVKSSLFEAFNGAGTWLRQKGVDIVGGLTSGISEAAAAAKRIVADAGRMIQNDFLSVFNPFGSPSRPMVQKGKDIVAGIQLGITQGTGGAVGAMTVAGTRIIVPINTIPLAALSAATRTTTQLGTISTGMGTLAANTATRTGQIVGSTNNMAGGIGAAVGRVVTSLTTQDRRTDTTQANHATRMGQIRGQADAMERGIGAAVGRFIGDMTRQDTKTNQTQANHNTRMGQIRGQADAMQRGIGNTVNQFIGHMIREDNKTNQTQANHNTRMGQIRGQADAMQRGIGATVSRFIGNMLSQDNQTNRTQANHGTRMGQINAASTRMADNTGTQTGRVNRSYQGMQRQVDSLHGKNIAVSSTANVRYPPDSELTSAVRRAADIISHAFVADGAMFFRARGGIDRRAQGGIDRLPDQALISPVKGPGLVQWAEAETGGEAFIPLAPTKRDRSLRIWRETGRILGALAGGGLLNLDTTLDDKRWAPAIQRLQTLSEADAVSLGRAAAGAMGNAAGLGLGRLIASLLTAPQGPGASMTGNWAAGIRPWVQYITSKLNISGSTYAGHHPAESHAVDLALSQDGMKNTAPAVGPSGNDLYSRVARWIDVNILAKATPGWYVGTHAAIHTRGGQWHPASSQVGRRGQTYAHDDHVHLSFDPHYDGPTFGVPGNYSAPNFNWDEGKGPPAFAAPISSAISELHGSQRVVRLGNVIITPSGAQWTQAQMYQALLGAGLDSGAANTLARIGMRENSGGQPYAWSFPSVNPTGVYHSAWALQEASHPGVDFVRLDRDINYAASIAASDYRKYGLSPWSTAAAGGIFDRLGRIVMADGGIKDLVRRRIKKKQLELDDEDWGASQSAIRGVRGNPAQRYDQGGWLQPGITVASNLTGRPERVVDPHTEDKTVGLLTKLVKFAAGGIRANPFIIGDSISWLSRKELLSKIPGASLAAFPGVQWPWGANQLHANPPHSTVVYLLGTNFGASAAQMSSLLNSNPLSKFVLMTLSIPQKWEAATNAAVRATKNRNPWRVAIADWHAAVAAHPNYLGPDRVHPNTATGRSAFANVAAGALHSLASFAAALQSLEFNRILKLRTLAAPYLDHKPADYYRWSGNQQFAYWARFPAVVALLKAIHQKEIEGWFKKVSGHNYLYGKRFPDFASGGIRLPAGSVRSQAFDEGGYLRPGVTVAENRTGRAERVVAPATDDKTVALLTQLVAIMGEQNRLLRTMPGAQADALNSVAYRAMSYR